MSNVATILGTFVAFVLVLGFIAIIMAYPTMWLWNNCLIGAVDGVNDIGFWQALGINVLAGILFKNSSSSKND